MTTNTKNIQLRLQKQIAKLKEENAALKAELNSHSCVNGKESERG